MSVRIRMQVDSRDKDAAFASLITLLKYATLIQKDSPLLIHYLTGMGILFIALDQVNYVLRNNKLSNEQLEALSQLLSELPSSSAALIRTFKGHYNLNTQLIDQVVNGNLYGNSNGYRKTLKNIPYIK